MVRLILANHLKIYFWLAVISSVGNSINGSASALEAEVVEAQSQDSDSSNDDFASGYQFQVGEVVDYGNGGPTQRAEIVEAIGEGFWRVRRCDSSRREWKASTGQIRSIRFSNAIKDYPTGKPVRSYGFWVPSYGYNVNELRTWQDKLGGRSAEPGHFYLSPSGRWIAVATDSVLRILDLTTGRETKRLQHPDPERRYGWFWAVAATTDEKTIITARTNTFGSESAAIVFWDRRTGERIHEAPLPHKRSTVSNLIASPNGKYVVAWILDERAKDSGGGYLQWYDTTTFKLVQTSRFPMPDLGYGVAKFYGNRSWITPQSMTFIDNDTAMLLSQHKNDQYGNSAVYSASVHAGLCKFVAALPVDGRVYALAASKSKNVYVTAEWNNHNQHEKNFEYTDIKGKRRFTRALKVVIRDLRDHHEIRTIDLPFKGSTNAELSISDDGTKLLVSNDLPSRSTVVDLNSGEIIGFLGIGRAQYVPNSDLVAGFYGNRDGKLQLWNATSSTPVVGFETYSTERAWAAVTADGDFAASPATKEVIDSRVVGFYHRPDRVRYALAGIPLAKIRNLPPNYQRPQASIGLTSVSKSFAVVRLDAMAFGDNVSIVDVKMSRLDRDISTQIKSELQSQLSSETKVTQTVDIPFPPGKNSMTLTLTAIDSLGVNSSTSELIVERPEHVEELSGRLFVLSVGVSKHKFSEYDLVYPAKDAEALAKLLKRQEGLTFGEVHTQLYPDKQATLKNIRDGLEWLERVATPDDVAVVFFAGHGLRGRRGLYYVTHEGDAEGIQYTCLNWEEIAETLGKIKAKQTLFLSDVCHAGGFAKTSVPMQKELAAGLQKIDNLVVFASSGPEELSREDDQWGHGAFTLALLNGLRGKADKDDDGVSIQEIIEYVKRETSVLTNGEQNPFVATTGGYNQNLMLAKPTESRQAQAPAVSESTSVQLPAAQKSN